MRRLVGLQREHGVTIDDIRHIIAQGRTPSIWELIEMRIHDEK